MKLYKILLLAIVSISLVEPVHAAKVVLRITKWEEDGILPQYRDNPGTYPVTQARLGCITFSGAPHSCIRPDGTRMFDTTVGTVESGSGEYAADISYTGDEIVGDIRRYEDVGLSVDHVLVFREDWLMRGTTGGPWAEDCRILAPQELANIRNAIANSNLRCKDTVKILQLLGPRVNSETVKGNRGDTWFDCITNATLMAHLSNFDGIGTECHVPDTDPEVASDGPATLDAMAAITKWTQDNGKLAHVFMGGTPTTYLQAARMKITYRYLWGKMDELGVDKKSDHLIYFRQGARPGVHITEEDNSLTSQLKWLIEELEIPPVGTNPTEPTSGLVAHWPLDEGSGTVATNTAGSSYTATLENGATWGSDAERGTYAVFDGTDDRIATTFTYALNATNDFTWAWWAKMEPTSHSGSIMVGNRYGSTGSETYEFIKMMPSKGAFSNTDSTGTIEDYDYADIAASSWHHYAMVKDGTSYQWYVDGVAEGTPVTINYNETSPLPFLIGGDDDGSGTKVNEHFEGCIDDVVLYRQALTQAEVTNVINGIYLPVITLTTLGTPVDSTEPTAWSDGKAPHSGADYVIPDTGNVRGESGTTTFPGNKLTVEAGGKYQVRSLKSSSQIGTVDSLVLEGGTDFSGDVALLAAGTGYDETNVLDGNLTNSGATRLVTYGSTINRSLEILSIVSGTGQLRAGGGATVSIVNATNSFAGIWQVDSGATLAFSTVDAIGAADIEVLAGGTLNISESGTIETTLTVADASATYIDLGGNDWVVSNLVFGGSSVADGLYSATELNALGTYAVFTGQGTLRVGARKPDEPVAHWKLDEGTGTVAVDSSGSGHTGSILNGATWGSDASRSSFVSFDGTDDRISTPFTYALSLSDNFTWAWWAKKAPTTHANSIMVGNRYGGSGTESLEFIKFMPNQAQFSNTGDAANIETYDYTDLPNDEWHHYAMVKTGTSYQWYVDGVAEGAPVSLTYSETSPLPFLIGGDDDGSGTKVNEHFEGSIDDVVLYDQPLSAAALNYVKNGIYFDFPDNNEPPTMQVEWGAGEFAFSWSGGFKLQYRTNLTEGAWTDYEGGGASPVTVAPTNTSSFFRLIEQ